MTAVAELASAKSHHTHDGVCEGDAHLLGLGEPLQLVGDMAGIHVVHLVACGRYLGEDTHFTL